MIENIYSGEILLSVIIRRGYESDGIEFFTPGSFSQQLGYMNRPANHIIPPHTHNPVRRDVEFTQEVLFIRSGKVRIDFYDDLQNYLESRILSSGDVVLLAFGGHGLEMLEQSQILEVKQGPYVGELDKIRFDPVSKDEIVLK